MVARLRILGMVGSKKHKHQYITLVLVYTKRRNLKWTCRRLANYFLFSSTETHLNIQDLSRHQGPKDGLQMSGALSVQNLPKKFRTVLRTDVLRVPR